MANWEHRDLGEINVRNSNKQNLIIDRTKKFEEALQLILTKYPADERKTLLLELIGCLCEGIRLQSKLVLMEEGVRFLFSEDDYHKMLDAYLPLFKELKTLPRTHKGSVYEISIVSNIDTILKSHCYGENVE
jgi:hypothetical protein